MSAWGDYPLKKMGVNFPQVDRKSQICATHLPEGANPPGVPTVRFFAKSILTLNLTALQDLQDPLWTLGDAHRLMVALCSPPTSVRKYGAI